MDPSRESPVVQLYRLDFAAGLSDMKRNRLICAVMLFFASFILYIATLYPSLAAESDSGELVTAAVIGGVAHPPGYPLYTMAGHLFSLLPVADPAYRLNVMSAFFASITAVVVFFLFLELFGDMAVSCGCAALFAVSRNVWKSACAAEVFSLNLFFITLLLLLFFIWRREASDGDLRSRTPYYFFFVLGLSLSHHHTVLFLVPLFTIFIFLDKMYRFFAVKRAAVVSALLFFSGLLPYLYLPVAALSHPPVNWGDPSTPGAFFRVVTRAGYGTLSLASLSGHGWSLEDYWRETVHYMMILFHQFSPILFVAGLVGALSLFLRRRRLFSFFFILFILFGFFFILIARFPYGEGTMALLERFFLPSFVAFLVFIGAVLTALRKVLKARASIGVAAVCVICVAFLCISNYQTASERQNYTALLYGRNLLSGLEEGSVIFLMGDVACGSVLYCQCVEGLRSDVIPLFEGLLVSPWYRAQQVRRHPELSFLENLPPSSDRAMIERTVCEAFAGLRPVYFNHPSSDPVLTTACAGLAYRVMKPGDEQGAVPELAMIVNKYQFRGDCRYDRKTGYFTRELLSMYGLAWLSLARQYFNAHRYEEAKESLISASSFSPDLPEAAFLNGELSMEAGKWDDAEAFFLEYTRRSGEWRDTFINLAVIYARKGLPEKAKVALRKLRSLPQRPKSF